jgi:uncharacterized protein (TIGR03085 family)
MTRTNVAARLRRTLCDVLDEVGPDAPTLCEGWTTRDLAAHLVVRETRPDAAAGILVKSAAPYGDRVRDRVGSRPWASLVDTVRSGPPRLSPMRVPAVDDLTNTIEYFVHLEDVRRARIDQPIVALEPAIDDALFAILRRGARLFARRSPVGLVLAVTGRDPITAKTGEPSVTIRGSVGEIILFLYGRSSVARVEFDGPADAIERLKNTRFGI